MQPSTRDAVPMQREHAADTNVKRVGPKRRRKLVDGRTRSQRRVRELTAGYLVALGEPALPELRDRCERAAQLVTIAEESRRKALAGGIGLDDLVRIENTAARAVHQLGLNRKREPERPSLQEYLAQQYGSNGKGGA